MGTLTQALTQESDIGETTVGYVNLHEASKKSDETHPRLTERMAKVTLSDSTPATDDQAPTVEMLKHRHIQALATYLDPMNNPVTWLDVGKRVFHGDVKTTEKVEQLKHAYAGGGSSGNAFIEYLKLQDCTVRTFQTTAENLGRKDIVRYIKQCNIADHNMDFGDLDHEITQRISVLLDKGGPGIKNWRDFAYEFDCEDDLVDNFQTAVMEKQQSSPTEGLITLMKTHIPKYKLCDFSVALSAAGRLDVQLYIDDLIKTITSK